MTKKKYKRFVIVVYILALMVFSIITNGCSNESVVSVVVPATESIPGTNPPANQPWSMKAVLVNNKGEALETLELSLNVMIWEQEDGRNYYSATFNYPENVYNSISGVMPYPSDENAYTCCTGFGYEKGSQSSSEAILFYFGLDLEKECFIMDIDDGQDVYLIAHTSPDADITALWEYFQPFIHMVPDQFPEVIG